jgi:gamma-glutamylcyclotransferase (GGCT)/AIG2-like uncharacterized protein YtfP
VTPARLDPTPARSGADGRLFAYGTLAIPEVMLAVTGRAFRPREATLVGYARLCVKGCSYPGIVPAPSGSTPGRLFDGIDAEIWERLDRFESDLYDRRRLIVRSAAGDAAAFAYVVRDSQRAALSDQPWDPARFVERELEQYLVACGAFRAEEARRRQTGR